MEMDKNNQTCFFTTDNLGSPDPNHLEHSQSIRTLL